MSSSEISFKIQTESVDKKKKKKKKKKNRCNFEGCKKKLSITAWSCKCHKKFCQTHKMARDHHCTFDWKIQQQNVLKVDLEKGKSIDTKNYETLC